MFRLSVRILLGYFLIVALAGVLVLRVVADQIGPSVRETIEEVMIDSANWLAALASRDFEGGQFADRNFSASLVPYAQRELNANVGSLKKQRIDFDVYLTDLKGQVVFDSTGQWLGRDFSQWRNVHRTLKGEYGARSTRVVQSDETSSVYHVSAPILIKSASGAPQLVGTLTVAKPVSSVTPIIEKARRQIYWQGGLLILAALLIGLLITWRLQLAITKLLSFANQAAQGEHTPTPKIRTTELNWLAQAMAKMRDELRGKRYLEQYTQSLAHELKSPLSAIAASNELLADPAMSPSDRQRFSQLNYEQTEKMRNSIDRMLEAARTENMSTLERHESIPWYEFLHEVVGLHQALAASKEIQLELLQHANSAAYSLNPLSVTGDPNLLRIALSNLIKNSLDFTSAGGIVSISAALVKHNGRDCVETKVIDTGMGIPDFALERVKERFYSLARPDGTKGSGLGLSIVQHIAQVHGGTVDLINRSDRAGCTAIFTLPSSKPNKGR